MLTRPNRLRLGESNLDLPVFFPSISSVKTNLSLLNYVRVLTALGRPGSQFLVSAFDLGRTLGSQRDALRHELSRARRNRHIVLMDSGNYESYWKDAQSTWLQSDFHDALREFPCDLAFSFDEQQPPPDFDAHVQVIVERYKKDQSAALASTIIPIIHRVPEELPALCVAVADAVGVEMVAVAERGLGSGLFARFRTVAAVRSALDASRRYIAIHLLGTGNPLSIALYCEAGADSFDGLEWCQTVVDHESALLFHFAQADFFADQTQWGDEEIPFKIRVLAHNLTFYADWMARMHDAISAGRGRDFCRLNFPRRIFNRCAAALAWESDQ